RLICQFNDVTRHEIFLILWWQAVPPANHDVAADTAASTEASRYLANALRSGHGDRSTCVAIASRLTNPGVALPLNQYLLSFPEGHFVVTGRQRRPKTSLVIGGK